MRKVLILIFLMSFIVLPVSAMEFSAPKVPEIGEDTMPKAYDSFSEGLWYVIRTALGKLQPSFASACTTCLSLIAVALLTNLVTGFSSGQERTIRLVGTLMIGWLMLQQTDTFVHLSREVITQLSDYGKLLLPVIAAAHAAQGGTTGAAAIYGGTLIFDSVLTTVISAIAIPLVYIYVAISVANSAFGNETLKELRTFIKWITTWILKILLYVFTGYISMTGVISGTTDAAAIKAAKLAISSVVPMVGGIISDASETILVSAGLMKNAVGIYGLLAITSVWIGPFLQIGMQYLLLKATGGVCAVICGKDDSALVRDFSVSMGFLLAMTGAVCVMLLISIVCFMKGVS